MRLIEDSEAAEFVLDPPDVNALVREDLHAAIERVRHKDLVAIRSDTSRKRKLPFVSALRAKRKFELQRLVQHDDPIVMGIRDKDGPVRISSCLWALHDLWVRILCEAGRALAERLAGADAHLLYPIVAALHDIDCIAIPVKGEASGIVEATCAGTSLANGAH